MNIHTIVNSIFQSKTYILSKKNNKEAWLIDCGDVNPILEYLKLNKLTLNGILITHTHLDHIYGLNKINSYFPNIKVYTSKEGNKGLYNIKYNLSKFNEQSWTYNFKNVIELNEQSELYLFDRCIDIYCTPGHDISCLSYKIESYLFSGDSYIPGFKTFTQWPLSDKKNAKISEKKILRIAQNENLQIKAGH